MSREGGVQLWFWELAFLFPQGVVWKGDLVSFWLLKLPNPLTPLLDRSLKTKEP